MRRVLCVWFPNWPIQRLRRDDPKLRRRPIVVFADGGRGLRVTACSAESARQGVTRKMLLAEARGLLQRPHSNRNRQSTTTWKRADPKGDLKALRQLAFDCQRYTPFVSVEEREEPESLLLDITGCAHLHGDERGLLRAIQRDLSKWGTDIRTALADTIGAAWAIAHEGRSGTIVPAGDCRVALECLPVGSLRISEDLVESLQRLGVQSIGDLLRLPRSTLPSRFGKKLVHRIDQALGTIHEVMTPEHFVAPPSVTWSTDEPIADWRGLVFIFQQLLTELLSDLACQRFGILEAWCELHQRQGMITLPLRVMRPSIDKQHLTQLFELACENQRWCDVILFRLKVVRVGEIEEAQALLFDAKQNDTESCTTSLIERLSSRLGEQAVLRIQFAPDSLPEASVQFVPWLGTAKTAESYQPDLMIVGARPWRLLPKPEPVKVLSVVPEGPPLRLFWRGQAWEVAQSWGPERIAACWLHNLDVQRDYYRVETQCGFHWWLFRQGALGPWFLHGFFD